MKRLVITRTAFRDLLTIWNYIAQDSIDAADRVRDLIRAEMDKLAEMPGMGHVRPDVNNSSYRFWGVFSYLIAYRVRGRTLYISRVVHGRQNLKRMFKRRKRGRSE
jgi:plasmid stabilization system protein ParE